MFKTLLIKEWKEKALIAAFGLGLMVVFLAAFLVFGDNQDLRDLIPAGFLIVLFPFLGLMLGAGAFESEFRNGSWAFLLSRPVRKETIWLAKLTALLSIMAVFWLVFIGLMAVVSGLGEVVAGFSLPEGLGAGLEFFPLILLSSVFYFSVAFSLSILSERQLSLVFGSFFLGFILQGVLSYFAFQAGDRYLLSHAGQSPWFDAYKLALIFSSLAFLGASLLTFTKADFSQPKKKILTLANYSSVFLILAWLLAAAWPAIRPGPKEKLESGIDVVGGEAYFSTTKGLYRYDIAGDKIKRISRWRGEYSQSVIGGGKVLYVVGWDLREGPALRVMNKDGSGKRLLAGDHPVYLWFLDFILSPDGQTAVFLYEEADQTSSRSHKKNMALVRTDGSGLTKLPPLGPGLAGEGEGYSWVGFVAWLESPDRLLLTGRSQAGETSLWTYDLATGAQARLFESPRPGQYSVSPGRDFVLMVSRQALTGPVEVGLLDIGTAERSSVMTVENPRTSVWFSVRRPDWNRSGDKVAFLVQQEDGVLTPAVYLLSERRVVMPNDVRIKGEPDPPPSLGWIGDAKLMLAIPQERALKILDPGLALERSVPVPASMGEKFVAVAADNAVLVLDFDKESIWRLDSKTEKWKKIW